MRITVSGGSGFIGSALVRELIKRDHQVVQITRESFKLPLEEFIGKKIEGVDALVNLAGAPISKRWTDKWIRELSDSRILTTRKIAEGIAAATTKPKVFISASGIGIYDNTHTHTEESTNLASDFMAQLCRDWEAEAMSLGSLTRVAILRQGVVLGDGGMLDKLRFPFSVGLGATIGNGKQPFSFIHIDDLIAIIMTVIENKKMSGIYNAVAPWPTDNRHFTEVLAKVVNQPFFLRVPLFALKLLYGEGSQVVASGQRVLPERLIKEGFQFRYPTIEKALVKALR
jgi:uncharacterized protein (TIGR01777 family)